MEVILLQDVKKVGKKGEVVKVSDGYAKNFLLARHLAVIASEKSLEIKDQQDKEAKALYEQNKAKAKELKEKIEKITVEIEATSGGQGKMFGAVSNKQICEELEKQYGFVVDKKKFIGDSTIKTFGLSILKVELFKDVVAQVKVNVKEK